MAEIVQVIVTLCSVFWICGVALFRCLASWLYTDAFPSNVLSANQWLGGSRIDWINRLPLNYSADRIALLTCLK